MLPRLRDPAWSPYVAGMLIGLLQIPAFLLINTALGASSSYVTVAGNLAALVDPAAAKIDYIARHLGGAKNWWQVALVVGIALGAWLSSRLGGTARSAFSPIWTRAAGIEGFGARAALGFLGGVVLLIGARIADGCPSGHGLSGLAQTALGSFLAVTFMFVGGIAAAALFRKL